MSSANRYRGRTPGDAMKKAREELGDDARLVEARRVSAPDAPPVYEVTVIPGGTVEPTSDPALEALRREVASLRQSLRTGGTTRATNIRPEPPAALAEPGPGVARRDPGLAKWIDLLCRRGVSESSAERISDLAAARAPGGRPGESLEPLRTALARELGRVADPDPVCETTTIFVGPSGAGKTTVLAKMAAMLVSQGQRPVVMTCDAESFAGEDTLEAVAGVLGLEMETAFLEGSISELAERAAHDRCLVDTPARTPFDGDGLSALERIVSALPGAEVLPVVPATLDPVEARLLCDAYGSLGAHRVVLTKLDEMAQPGRLVDLIRSIGHPVSWVTFGRSTRGFGADVSDPRVLDRVLGTQLAVEQSA